MTIKEIALWGIALNVGGVIMLFAFGMPFRVPTGGAVSIIAEQSDEREARMDRVYTMLGLVALVLVLVGSAMQAYAVWLTPLA